MTEPALPLGLLKDLLAWWRKTRTRGFIIGGLAVSLRADPRVTRDVDAVIVLDKKRWHAFLEKGTEFHFYPRIPEPLDFAERNRIFLLHHERSKIDLDLSVAGVSFEIEALQRAKKVRIGRLQVPVATAEDLIVLKAVARRHIDWADIEKLLAYGEDLDIAYIRKQVDQLAQMLEAPEIYEELDRRLVEFTKTRRPKKT